MNTSYRTQNKLTVVFLTVTLNGLGGCSHTLLYSVSVANYGNSGIILRQLPVKFNRPVNIHPGIPGVRDDIYQKGPFKHYPDSLPDQVEVVWQLAALEKCTGVREARSYAPGADPSERYTRKTGCTFIPIPGKVFRKTIDLNALLKTPAGQRAGKRVEPWWSLSGSRYGLIIEFDFRDQQLKVDTYNFTTNSWN